MFDYCLLIRLGFVVLINRISPSPLLDSAVLIIHLSYPRYLVLSVSCGQLNDKLVDRLGDLSQCHVFVVHFRLDFEYRQRGFLCRTLKRKRGDILTIGLVTELVVQQLHPILD